MSVANADKTGKLKLMDGRPADCSGRLEKEIRTYDFLDGLGIGRKSDAIPASIRRV